MTFLFLTENDEGTVGVDAREKSEREFPFFNEGVDGAGGGTIRRIGMRDGIVIQVDGVVAGPTRYSHDGHAYRFAWRLFFAGRAIHGAHGMAFKIRSRAERNAPLVAVAGFAKEMHARG